MDSLTKLYVLDITLAFGSLILLILIVLYITLDRSPKTTVVPGEKHKYMVISEDLKNQLISNKLENKRLRRLLKELDSDAESRKEIIERLSQELVKYKSEDYSKLNIKA